VSADGQVPARRFRFLPARAEAEGEAARAYLYAARRLGLKLVSEDADLKKYSETIGVDELVAELEGPGRS